jgi:hypothetical protein
VTSGHEKFDTLVACLHAQGLHAAAESVQCLLTAAWTTSSELLGELGLELLRIQKAHRSVFSPETDRTFRVCMKAVRKVWPSIRL